MFENHYNMSQPTTTIQQETLEQKFIHAKNIVFLLGAGISKAAGIQTYQDNPNYNPETLTIKAFKKDPVKWWQQTWLVQHKQILVPNLQPTNAHHALALIRKEDYVVTQNIDGLEKKAQVPVDQLSQVHGSAQAYQCVQCKDKTYTYAIPKDILTCLQCSKPLRPAVLLYDENYGVFDIHRYNAARRALKEATTIVLIGTSAHTGITNYAIQRPKAFKISISLDTIPGTANLIADVQNILPNLMELRNKHVRKNGLPEV